MPWLNDALGKVRESGPENRSSPVERLNRSMPEIFYRAS